MKKVLIAQDIYSLLDREETFLDRSDIKVFVALTNDELLNVHRAEQADLIITQLDMPGMATERICAVIREDSGLRGVSMILSCANTPRAIRAGSQCRANAVLLEPLHPLVLTLKAQQLLSIAAREMLRVAMTAQVDSKDSGDPFSCSTGNISVTGMLIATATCLAEGARLSCRFSLPGTGPIRASGKIIRITEPSHRDGSYQYGLMFTDVAPGDKQLIADYVEVASRNTYSDGKS
jgi:CheY-like chemotaxis protein